MDESGSLRPVSRPRDLNRHDQRQRKRKRKESGPEEDARDRDGTDRPSSPPRPRDPDHPGTIDIVV